MADLPAPPTVVVQVPTTSATTAALPVSPSVTVFPVAGPPDQHSLLYAPYNGSSYPLRSSITADQTRVVVWIGPVAPDIDEDYALDNVDVWWSTGV
jgi:hypothetical protein